MGRNVRLVFAALTGFVAGSAVNMALVHLGASVVPPPAGADVTAIEGLKAALHLFEPKHFVFPFLAHGLGTLFGAAVATLLTPGRSPGPAWAVGLLFLAGGVTMAFLLPAPPWFTAVDLLLAYLPAAWIGRRLAMTVAANGPPKAPPRRGAA